MPAKSDPTVRRILARWRSLTGGTGVRDPDRRTLVAFSGGADSSALLLALATQASCIVAAHVVHDMRPEAEALADLAACERLCRSIGVPLVSRRVGVCGGGNIEAVARRERYQALAALAVENGCRFVATGHHAEDQLETILMRLLRGSGPRGLRGIFARRRLADGITLVRPMLHLRRLDAERLCGSCGWTWRVDATNADTSRVRARLRHDVVPLLEAIAPGAAVRSSSAAAAAAAAFAVIRAQAMELVLASRQSEGCWDRKLWKRASLPVVAESAASLVRSVGGVPRHRETMAVARAARSDSGETRRYQFEGCTVVVHADAIRVTT